MITYTFYPNSVTGLATYVTVAAHNYLEAKHKVLKIVYAHTEDKHLEHINETLNQSGGYSS